MFRGGRMTFTPEHRREGNWIVEAWLSELEKAYWADPAVQKYELPDTWPSQMESQGESWTDSAALDCASTWPASSSVRTRNLSVQDGWTGTDLVAAVAHMVNQSIKRQGPVHWNFDKDVLKSA